MARTVLKAAADSISLDRVSTLTGSKKTDNNDTENAFLRFDEKEILKMPKTFRKEFRTQGCTAHVRKRRSGKTNWNYEIRYRRNGYNVAVSANNLEDAKNKFIAKLNEVEKFGRKTSAVTVPTRFGEFAEYFFETFYKRKVTPSTLKNTINRYNNHVKPLFGEMQVRNILASQCQQLIDKLGEEGKGKTADEIFSLLNAVFKMAIKHGLITHNPMDIVFHAKHETQHGSALTKEEEKQLLEATAGTPYQLMFAVALYTGMRPNEYYSAKIEGDFIKMINSKRKNGKVEYKKIPIIPPLKPYLKGVTELKFYGSNRLRERFSTVFKNHKLYDLRTIVYLKKGKS